MIAYISDTDDGFDAADGVPYNYDRSSRLQDGFDLNFYSVTAGTYYYLWVKSSSRSDWGSFYLNITVPTTPVVIPTYTASVINTNQIQFTVSNRGNYYLRYFVRLTNSPQTTIYDTWTTYGYLVTNTTLTVSNLDYNTSYTVNVGYSSSSDSGAVEDWIGS